MDNPQQTDHPTPTSKPKPTRCMAIDYGMARIGLAISDEMKIIATPLRILQTEKRLEQTVDRVVQEVQLQEQTTRCHIDEIIVGLPLRMNGSNSVMSDEVQLFIACLREKLPSSTIIAWDERLSTAQAERAMREGGLSRKKRSQISDTVSAVIILQSYLARI